MATPIITDDVRKKLMDNVRESVAISTGRGSSSHVLETILSKHDRFGCAPVQLNSEMIGLTFFTKPRFNLTRSSIRQDPTLAMLDTLDPLSWMFSIRCNLDTVFAESNVARSAAGLSPFFNDESPFNVPAGNLLTGITGFPDFNIEYKTTESGYFAEDMTLARGADWGRRTYNLSCSFRDIQGGYMMNYFYYWIIAMALQMDGTIVAYSDDREANRLNYTCSIYRLVLDPSMRTVVKWAKATGCYPVSVPMGDAFNFSPGDSTITAIQNFNINFVANNIRYMDPRHLEAFNTLVQRYAGKNFPNGRKLAPVNASSNFTGVPYIDIRSGSNELQFWARPSELENTTNAFIESTIANIRNQMTTAAAVNRRTATVTP